MKNNEHIESNVLIRTNYPLLTALSFEPWPVSYSL